MASSSQKRRWWRKYKCKPSKMVRVPFPGEGRDWNLLVARESRNAWLVFIDIMDDYGYKFRESAGGTYNCRRISGSLSYSLHSYGLAVDLNPSVNSYGQRGNDFPAGFVTDVEATGLFRWGGRWRTPDPMHFEIDVPPSAIPDYTPPSIGDRMLGFNVGQIGDPSVEGDEALTLQLMLLDRGIDLPQFGADGFAGDETRRGLAGFQNRHGIDEPGVVGPRTYSAFNRPANGGLSEAQVKDLANQQIAGSVLTPPDG